MKTSIDSGTELELPVAPSLPRVPAKISLSEMMRKCQELRQWFPESIPTLKERWEAKREVEFQL